MSHGQHDPRPLPLASPPALIPQVAGAAPSPIRVPAGPPPAGQFDVFALLKALRRRLTLAIGLGLVLASLGAVATYFIVSPAKYSAQAMLHVSSRPPRILVDTAEGQLANDFATYQRTQLAMLRGRKVLGAALSRQEVAALERVKRLPDPVEWLDEELKVDFANGSEVLRLSMEGLSPSEPAILVNAVVDAYLEQIVRAEQKQRRDRYDMLQETWRKYQDNLKSKREELNQLTMAAGSDDPATRAILQRSSAELLSKAEADLAATRTELRALEVELQVVEARLAEAARSVSAAEVEAELANDAGIRALTARVEEAQAGHDELKRLARKPDEPTLKRYREAHEAARKALMKRRQELTPAITEAIARLRETGGERLAHLRERVQVLQGLERLQGEDVERLSKRGRTAVQAVNDLNALQEEIGHANELAKKMGAEIAALDLELQAEDRIKLVEKAVEPRTKDELRQAKAAGAMGLGTFAFVLVGIAFLEHRARRVDSADDLSRTLGLRIVGLLPPLPRGRHTLTAGRARAIQSLMVESVDAARTALVHAARYESLRAVMITSAVGGEGKTSLACHLAASLARGGHRTLLLDCDLRRPSAHKLFDLPSTPGVCEVLRDEVDLDQAIVGTEADGLWVLPAGACDAEALGALARGRFARLIATVRQRYDFVVIDSAPVLPVVDSLLIAQHADAVLYAVLRDVSRLPMLQAAHERLQGLGIRSVGAVLAGAPAHFYGTEYYYTAAGADPGGPGS